MVLLVGFAVGASFGDQVIHVIEETLGEPWDDLLFGIGGATFASLGYEIAVGFGGSRAGIS